MKSMNKKSNDPWDCSNSMNPENKYTCWGDTAYQKCGGAQWAYDAVMQEGGNTKKAFDLMNTFVEADCKSCDASKAGCENSMFPDTVFTF